LNDKKRKISPAIFHYYDINAAVIKNDLFFTPNSNSKLKFDGLSAQTDFLSVNSPLSLSSQHPNNLGPKDLKSFPAYQVTEARNMGFYQV